MPKKPKKQITHGDKTIKESGNDQLSRIIDQLIEQLKPYLPIKSFNPLIKELKEVVVEGQKLPLEMYLPHISDNLFPIESTDDLKQKLSTGVRRAVILAQQGFITVKSKSHSEILAKTIQPGKGYLRPKFPFLKKYNTAHASEPIAKKGGK